MKSILFLVSIFVSLHIQTCLGTTPLINLQHSELLEIVNIRVGQGDATLILGPEVNGKRVTVLFDAGDIPSRDGGNILRTVLRSRWGITELDHLIVSHDDADHIGGIAFGGVHGDSFVLGFDDAPGSPDDDDGDGDPNWLGDKPFFKPDPEELGTGDDFTIKHFIDYGEGLMRKTQAIQKYLGFVEAFVAKGSQHTIINDQQSVDTFEIDLGGGVRMICFAANGFVRGNSERVKKVDSPNERSLSFLVNHNEFNFLISGDLIGRRTNATENARVEEVVGQAIVDNGFDVDVLHVNHHGASNGSSEAFLNIIKPNIAVISAGNRNSHKHPSNATLRRLVASGVDRIIQTSWGTTINRVSEQVRDHQAIYQSDVIIRSDGNKYEVSTTRTWNAD